MSKHVARIIRGIGTVLEISPDPDRVTVKPLYNRRGETPGHALYRSWRSVGNYLIAASGAELIGEGSQQSAQSAEK